MIERPLNWVVALARTVARVLGYELGVLVGKHEIRLVFRDPDDTESMAWDDSAFVNGCVFVGNWANPFEYEGDRGDLVATEHYETLMKEDFVGDILRLDSGKLTLKVVLGVLVLLNTLLLGAILMVGYL